MTAKHMLDAIVMHTRTSNLTTALGLDPRTVSAMRNGEQTGMNIRTLDQIQRKTGLPFDTLMGWYRLPEGAVLDRLQKPCDRADR
jgi:DNA-binding Xre family transcriptional regulator